MKTCDCIRMTPNDVPLQTRLRRLNAMLSAQKFTSELTPEETAKCNRIKSGNEKGHNLAYLIPYYCPNLYLAGKQRVFGKFKAADIATAVRLSDILRLYFWPFRQRGTEPHPQNLNLGLERAQRDLENEKAFVAIFDQIKTEFQAEELLPRPGDTEHRRNVKQAAHYADRLLELDNRLIVLEQKLEAAVKRLDSADLEAARRFILSPSENNC